MHRRFRKDFAPRWRRAADAQRHRFAQPSITSMLETTAGPAGGYLLRRIDAIATAMNPHRARKKIVAYAITSFVALCTAALGVALGYSALADRHFLHHGDAQALNSCLNNPQMDCDPRRWWVLLVVGSVLAVLGLAFLLRHGKKLWRLVRAGGG